MSLSMFGLCNYKEETLVVIAHSGMGISIANRRWWGRGEDSRRCVMLPQMEDMLIHEGYIGSRVRLAIAVRGEDELLVVFPTLLPDRTILELVGRETMKLLRRPDSSLITSDDEDGEYYDGRV
ncbi:hypothetical protein Q9L58_004609 [Maublancomyces gigas]|uniref:Phosphatidylinositol N-acetylglucosaminyltransferase subunit H conserved domain-containing protein n=1 Tax=Discina gigas TaxID=1032678 RepID=A0ABR3GKX5_9PEZI